MITEEQQISEDIKQHFNGTDPIKDIWDRMSHMSKEDIQKMVLISCNQIGTAVKQGEYEGVADTAFYISLGAHKLLDAYDTACMEVAFQEGKGGIA